MKVIVDAMSGDNAPLEIIKGASLAQKEYGAEIILVGDENVIHSVSQKEKISLTGMEIIHAPDVITMEDSPLSVREKKESSMRVGFRLLREKKADAFVGAGNTGAMHVGSTLFVHRIKGVRRSAIATIMPLSNPVLLLDAGANIEVTEEFLLQFAIMGSVYMNKIFGIDKPRVGLLNNGTEERKGTDLQVKTHQLLAESENLHFIGNVEGKDIPFDKCDVLVCDGFTGNIALKSLEGMALFVMKKLKKTFASSLRAKLAGFLAKKKIKKLRRELDASEYGGAPFLGIAAPVIKAHGSSDARAIKNAIRQAMLCHETGIIEHLTELFENQSVKINKENETPAESPLKASRQA